MDPILLMIAILLALVVLSLATTLVMITAAGIIYIWIHVYPRRKAVPIHPHVPLLVYGPLLMLISLAHGVIVFLMMLIRRSITRYTAGIESGYFAARGEAMELRVKIATLKGIGFKGKVYKLSCDLKGNVIDRATTYRMKARVRLEPYIP